MDDKEILRLLESDINKGAEMLLQKYSGFVYSIVLMRLSRFCDSSEIEDCTAEVLGKFIMSLSSYDPEKSGLKTYIGVMARNHALNYLRERQNSVSIDGDEAFLQIASDDDTEKETIDKMTFGELMEEINALGTPDSFILIRKYYFGQSSKEIGKELGMPAGNVDVRAHRAIEKLKKNRRDK